MEILNMTGVEFLQKINYFVGQFSLLIVPAIGIFIGFVYYLINKQ